MGIAQQSTGLATAAYYEALKYAKERTQFGKTLIEIPAVKRYWIGSKEKHTL